ncbi:MAG: class I SAM-dependent methyltransferase [Roseovarius sp.]|nr:class I SAM-dependent methyltransferase [Roseovarius sp.]
MELEIGALVSELVLGHGYMHYGYFPKGLTEELSLQALGQAQHAYFEKLLETIGTVPGEIRRILDVGSGAGANAKGLIGAGFDVTCVSPSTQMNEMARANLPNGTRVIDSSFEDLATNARYDLRLFAESFHYMELKSALTQVEKYADIGVVIFDYFHRDAANSDARDGKRSTHAAFLEAVARQERFEVLVDKDVTAAITPTFMILENLKSEKLAPFVRRFRAILKQRHPLRAKVFEAVFGRSMDKLGPKPEKLASMDKRVCRSERFAQSHEYRLIAMCRKPATT